MLRNHSFKKITGETQFENSYYKQKYSRVAKSAFRLHWAKDTAGHNSAYIVFAETGNGTLRWNADAEGFGNLISGKHKDPVGLTGKIVSR